MEPDWELSKENYKPLRQGREPDTIATERRPLAINTVQEELEAKRR